MRKCAPGGSQSWVRMSSNIFSCRMDLWPAVSCTQLQVFIAQFRLFLLQSVGRFVFTKEVWINCSLESRHYWRVSGPGSEAGIW